MSLFDLFVRPDPAAVVRDHGADVLRHLKRIFGPSADVDDVYQQVFMEVLRALPSFQGRARLSTWIRRITWNVAYQEMRSHYRQKSSTPFDESLPEMPAAPAPSLGLEERDAMRRVYDAIERLDPRLRVVVVLYDVEGCTLKEIGEALGRPLPTVASQLATGRARLAACLGEDAPAATTQGTKKTKRMEP
jgi:RNA polymerase sigma-70 factor, ECF subfamily